MAKRSTQNKGLSSAQAAEVLKRYGPNELKEKKKESLVIKFLRHFTDFLVVVLLAAAIIAAVLGEMLDAAMIFVIVLMQAVLGFAQEYRAEKSFEALQKMVSRKTMALREGKVVVLDVRELAPGDVVLVEAGDHVPADGTVIESFSLAADEAALTGESMPVAKNTTKENRLYMGTVVVAGKGRFLVEQTGMATKMGKISEMVQSAEKEQTPIEKDLEKMGKQIGAGVLVLCAIIFVVGVLEGFEPFGMFLTAVSLAVAAIPEGLPAVVVITLAVGVQRMSKRNAIVRKLKSVETLGCADVICTDKTGTLTKNEMTVRKVLLSDAVVDVGGAGYEPKGVFSIDGRTMTEPSEELGLLMRVGLLCNNSYLREDEKKGWQIIGDPTEGSLLVLGAKGGLWRERLDRENPPVVEFPFESERKMMTIVRKVGKGNIAYVKGAPEVVLAASSRIMGNGKIRKMTSEDRKALAKKNDMLTSKGHRTLALAYRELDGAKFTQNSTEGDLVFVGIAGMMDSPRPEVRGALDLCRSAGIRVIMITGDHPLTARAIAEELGIGNGEVVTGDELDKMDQAGLHARVERISVYARVSPAHKLRIIEALNYKGHVVAMTGDGVNDAPALKKSDIGVAMGITGTEVAKESADMVLTDDNFATIVAAIEEGRGIYDNIKKTLTYLLAGNMAEVGVIFFSMMIGYLLLGQHLLPLMAIQILWINLVTDGLPAVALAIDPIDRGVMKRKPRQMGESIWKGTGLFIFESPLIVTAATVAAFLLIASQGDLLMAQSLVFTLMVMFEKTEAFSARSLDRPVWKELFANKWLVYTTVLTLALHMAILYHPVLNELFHVKPLGINEWAVAIGLALFVFLYLEVRKWMISNKKKNANL